jgi:uncharacterized membrane protein YoaK (UPF0700 family)
MATQHHAGFVTMLHEESTRASSRNARVRGISVVLLCFAAGTTDVLSYLTLGHVFTSAMTGCAALLLLNLASYFVGCGLATLFPIRDKKRIGSPRDLRRLLAVECLLLFLYVVIALTGAGDDKTFLLIFLSAAAMGMQSIVARDLHEPGVSTVVLNPTVTSLGVAVTEVLLRRKRILPGRNMLHIAVLVAYGGGALLTALGLAGHIAAMDLLPLGAVAAVFLVFNYLCLREQEPAPDLPCG